MISTKNNTFRNQRNYYGTIRTIKNNNTKEEKKWKTHLYIATNKYRKFKNVQ